MMVQAEKSSDKNMERPVFLSVLSILSFISLIPVLIALFFAILFPESAMALVSNAGAEIKFPDREIVILISTTCFVLAGLLLWGVILMYLMRRGGYIMFVIPAGIILIFEIAAAIIGSDIFTGVLAFSTIFMITGFALMLRRMKNKSNV